MANLGLIARILAVLVAVVGAFYAGIPEATAILLVLGAVASIDIEDDQRGPLMLATLVLVGTAGATAAIPVVGMYVAAILGGLASAYTGAALAVIVTVLIGRLKP